MSKHVCLRCLLSFVTLLTLLVFPAFPTFGKSVTSQDITPPGTVLSLGANAGASPGSVELNWIAPGDDGNTGTATMYVVRYNTAPITENNWIDSTDVPGEPLPSAAGSVESMIVAGLPWGQRFYFAIKAEDEDGNASSVSNISSATAQFAPHTIRMPIIANGADNSAELPPVIPDTTEVLPPSTTQHLTSMSDAGTLTFSQWTPELEELDPGDVIVGDVSSGAPNGFLRKVRSISPCGGKIVVVTDPTTLEDAIQTGSFQHNQRLTPAMVHSASYAEGVTMAASPDGLRFEYSLDDKVLYDKDNNPKTKYDQVAASGTVSLDLATDFGARIEWFEVKKFWFNFSAEEAVELEIKWNLEIVELKKKVLLTTVRFTPITIMAGPLPVVFTPQMDLYIGVDGKLDIAVTAGVTQKATLKVGAAYDHGQWSPIGEFRNEFQFNPPTVEAKVTIKGYAELTPKVALYGVAGPYAALRPYLQLEVAAGWPISLGIGLYAGMEIEPGADVQVLGTKLADYSPGINNFRRVLAEWELAANTPPDAPSNPLPIDDAVDEPRNALLLWTGGDTDGDTVTYDVYLAPNDPYPDAQVATDQAGTSYDAGMLAPNTYYYWRIVAKDADGATNSSPVWSFRTGASINAPPRQPSSPSPADGSAGSYYYVTLRWAGGDPDGDAVTYAVYRGRMENALEKVCDGVSSPECAGSGEEEGGEMLWRVVSRDEHGRTTVGPLWTFSATGTYNFPPDEPVTRGPADNAKNQPLWTLLQWTSSDYEGDALTYDVYLEKDDETPDVLLCHNTPGTSCDPGLLATDSQYFWQVVARDEHDAVSRGPVWSFTTDDIVYVPSSEFRMGCDQCNPEEPCRAEELPLHTVYLDAYHIDRTEVTNAEYARCVAAGGCTAPAENQSWTRWYYYGNSVYDSYPVILVSWDQASAYCAWAGKRLPTEAEWEKAARGASDTRAFPWGDATPTCALANFYYNDYCVGDTSAAGSYPGGTSPYGALDMAGNVGEWVNDWWQSDYYSGSPGSNPPGPTAGTERVLRGGSWGDNGNNLRAANRNFRDPADWSYGVGFRCVAVPGG